MNEKTNKKLIDFSDCKICGKLCNLSWPSAVVFLTAVAAIVMFSGMGLFIYLATKAQNKITVTGTYYQKIKNQIADFTLTIEEKDKDKATAVKNASERSKTVVQQIKDFGIPEEDIETTSLNVYQLSDQVYLEGRTTYEEGDWVASYSINIILRDLTKSTELTELLANVEKATMWGPNLKVDDKKVDEAAILAAALEDATNKAQSLAKKSGRKLGEVINISEAGSYYPLYERSMAADGIGGGGGFPIEPGTSDTYKSVTVTFRLK